MTTATAIIATICTHTFGIHNVTIGVRSVMMMLLIMIMLMLLWKILLGMSRIDECGLSL